MEKQANSLRLSYVKGLHYRTGKPIRVHIANGLIEEIKEVIEAEPTEPEPLPWIGPGFVDLQINGFSGIDFNMPHLTEEAVHSVTRKLWAEGVTTYYPTVITNSDQAIEDMVRSISQACRTDSLTTDSIAGIHLEGPFISRLDGPRGAHDQSYVKAPDWELFERWQRAADGLIKIITLSPEWDEAPEFIARCVRNGIVVSIGHTAATSEQIQKAVQSGASMSTHLGNGAHQMLPRHPNYIWEQLAHDQLSSGVIADGFHLPLSVLKVFLKVKAEQLFLVSDAVYLSDLEPGEYVTHIGGRVVLTEEGRLHLAENPGLLAGSVQMLKAGVSLLVQSGICSPAVAWELATIQPASIMHLAVGGGLAVGAPADLMTFSWDQNLKLTIHDVYKHGHHVAGSNVISSSSQA